MCTRKSSKTNTIARACKLSTYCALGQNSWVQRKKYIYRKCFFKDFQLRKNLKQGKRWLPFLFLITCFLKLNSLSLSCIVLPETVFLTANQNKDIFSCMLLAF